MISSEQLVEVMRWWSFVGAPCGGVPLVRHLGRILTVRTVNGLALNGQVGVHVPRISLALAGIALLYFLCFSFTAGLFLPLATQVPGLTDETFQKIVALAAGFGSWLTALALWRGRWFVLGMAFSWFLAVWFAMIATAGG